MSLLTPSVSFADSSLTEGALFLYFLYSSRHKRRETKGILAIYRLISNASLFEGHRICRRLWRKQTDEMLKVGTTKS